MSFPSVDEQLEIIRRGTVEIVPEEELAEKLKKFLEILCMMSVYL